MQRDPPIWKSAATTYNSSSQLYLHNSFTRQKELFKPVNGNLIKWYSCGPTVYDESHMGHARCYISFDILRRVLQSYFNYDIIYCINITDIDDKIIIKARQEHLFKEYVKSSTSLTNEQFKQDLLQALQLCEEKFKKENDKDKRDMYAILIEKTNKLMQELTTNGLDLEKNIVKSKDLLSQWLDKEKGTQLDNSNSLFSELSSYYESQFHKDMHALNILPPNVLTRVSEYVPEIIKFIEKIMANSFAYESNGSVYFNTAEFATSKEHYYAKLVPEAFGDSRALAEGEGALSSSETNEKKNASDFALWKKSKPGEPAWDSPWGKGRPGWHIECSAMSDSIFGSQLDIHSGGVDLKFPHHDNEIAQSEAAYGISQWTNFFLHTGHLHIQGCKMSKSLKNFITIKEALAKYTSRQIRFLFLQFSWKDTLDYSDQGMEAAIATEKKFNEFFHKVKHLLREIDLSEPLNLRKWSQEDLQMNTNLHEKKKLIHEALCDSVNTPLVIKELLALVTLTNSYVSDANRKPNLIIIKNIALYITNLLKIFGIIEGSESTIGFVSNNEVNNFEETLLPYLNVLSKFRDDIRTEARATKQIPILKLCDELRDNVLPELGVRLEDQSNDRTLVKLCDKEQLLKEREQKILIEETKRKREAEIREAQRLKDELKSIKPSEMFLKETDKYSQFDERGVPTHDHDGKELSKNAKKNVEKTYASQVKSYETWLKNQVKK